MLQLIRIFILVLLAGMSVAAHADQEHVVSRQILRDPGATLTVAQVSTMVFSPAPKILASGYTGAAFWLRLVVRPRDDGGPLVLRIRPTYLDEITLYQSDSAAPGGWRSQTTGDRTPWSARAVASVQPGFFIQPQGPTTYYLRLKTTSSAVLYAQALTPWEAQRADVVLGLSQWFYLAVIVAILVWAGQDYWHSRQRLVALFMGLQAVQVAFSLAIMGHLAPLLPEGIAAHDLTNVLICAIIFAGLLFHRHLLGMFQPPRGLLWTLNVLIVTEAGAALLLLAGQTQNALRLNSLIGLVAAPLFLALAWTARYEAAPGLRNLRLFYSVLTLSLLLTFAPLLGLTQAVGWTLQGTLSQGLIAAGLMATLLHQRSRALMQQGQQAHIDLELAQQQLDLEREQLTKQRIFVDMLTHEVKTPLAIIRLGLDMTPADEPRRKRMDRAIRDIDTIIEHCRQTVQIEQGQLHRQLRACDVASVLSEALGATVCPERIKVATPSGDASRFTLVTDPYLLGNMLVNLLDNAVKYGDPAEPADVKLESAIVNEQPGIRITVSNLPGPAGFPDPDQVFLKYYRSPGAFGKSGSGLGLFLVRAMADQLGARVWYECPQGMVTFCVWLPLEARA